jgi:hypothetical protein
MAMQDIDHVSVLHEKTTWGFDLSEILDALVMTKHSFKNAKGKKSVQTAAAVARESGEPLLVRQSQVTRDPVVGWMIPSNIFYPQIAEGTDAIETELIEDYGIDSEHAPLTEEEIAEGMTERAKFVKRSAKDRITRLAHTSIKSRCLPLHFLPFFLARQSVTLTQLNNPLRVCMEFLYAIKQTIPSHMDDPSYLAYVMQFERNLHLLQDLFVTESYAHRNYLAILGDIKQYRVEAIERLDITRQTMEDMFTAAATSLGKVGKDAQATFQALVAKGQRERKRKRDDDPLERNYAKMIRRATDYSIAQAREAAAKAEKELDVEDMDVVDDEEIKIKKVPKKKRAQEKRTEEADDEYAQLVVEVGEEASSKSERVRMKQAEEDDLMLAMAGL